MANNQLEMDSPLPLFRVRTITAFVNLQTQDFLSQDDDNDDRIRGVAVKIEECVHLLRQLEEKMKKSQYEVQTLRIATNPFGEWLLTTTTTNDDNDDVQSRLERVDALLEKHDIGFCSLGPATTVEQIQRYCPQIIAASPRFSCSANLEATDASVAHAAAACIVRVSQLGEKDNNAKPFLEGGIGNFRFCVAASCSQPYIPFFPVAKSSSSLSTTTTVRFAVGLENGGLLRKLLRETKTIRNIPTVFANGMAEALLPLQVLCQDMEEKDRYEFMGIDTSLNPSLDKGGSVAAAIETLEELSGRNFGGAGTLAAAAALTTALQSLQYRKANNNNDNNNNNNNNKDDDDDDASILKIKTCGYSGLMLPVCEDRRLAALSNDLSMSTLLCISSVCGVGIDTVPLPGNVSETDLAALCCSMWRDLPIGGRKASVAGSFPFRVNKPDPKPLLIHPISATAKYSALTEKKKYFGTHTRAKPTSKPLRCRVVNRFVCAHNNRNFTRQKGLDRVVGSYRMCVCVCFFQGMSSTIRSGTKTTMPSISLVISTRDANRDSG